MKLLKHLFKPYGLTLLLAISSNYGCWGQQEAMFTQYMFNGLAINPAYAGSHQTLEFTALARQQWAGLEGAPSTQTFTAHSPLSNRSIGLGLSIIHDKIGVTSQFGVYGAYSYRIQFNNKGVLSMGLQAGFTQYQEHRRRRMEICRAGGSDCRKCVFDRIRCIRWSHCPGDRRGSAYAVLPSA